MHTDPAPLTARRGGPLKGRVRVPGDKSISHRALILGALAVGETRISGLLEGEDVLNTAKAVGALGARVERLGAGEWRVHGVGVAGFAEPARRARFRQFGHRLPAHARRRRRLPDHRDLRRRRLAAPAADAAGARAAGAHRRAHADVERWPPAADAGRRARTDPHCVRAAGCVGAAEVGRPSRRTSAPGETVVVEAEATRDHTEKMLAHFGADVRVEPHGAHGRRITLTGQPELVPRRSRCPPTRRRPRSRWSRR